MEVPTARLVEEDWEKAGSWWLWGNYAALIKGEAILPLPMEREKESFLFLLFFLFFIFLNIFIEV